LAKKDLSLLALMYGDVYVARIAMGANDLQTVRAILEAEAYDGPTINIAYSHCIAHGIDMARGMVNQKIAVETGYWPLFRYNPALKLEGKNPFQLDSKAPKAPFYEFAELETRFKMLQKSHPDRARDLMKLAQEDIWTRWNMYEKLAQGKEVREVVTPLQPEPKA
jgi:pyruvate-ferredoxin/flavodoxin oxidoreductase